MLSCTKRMLFGPPYGKLTSSSDNHQRLVIMTVARSMGRIVETVYNRSGQIKKDQVALACDYLNKGKVIALPTDTIYGLAAKVDESEAIKRIYEIKDRICTKPLSVCVSHLGEIENIADTTRVSRLLTSFFPGPVTLLLKRNPKLNPELNPGLDTIGIRIPDNNFIRAVCEEVGPLALTSANKSGGGDSTLVEDFKDLHPLLDCIFDVGVLRVPVGLDGEPKTHSLGSTVIDVTEPGKYKMIREGCSARRYINLLHRFGYRKEKTE